MEWIEDVVHQANELFEAAEAEIESSPAGSLVKFREGINKLLKAFLFLNDGNCEGDLPQLFEACKRIEPSLETIETEILLFQDGTASLDDDDLIDAANEVWDFMIDVLSEEGE